MRLIPSNAFLNTRMARFCVSRPIMKQVLSRNSHLLEPGNQPSLGLRLPGVVKVLSTVSVHLQSGGPGREAALLLHSVAQRTGGKRPFTAQP